LELFHPARRDTAYVALLGLDGSEAQVAVGDAPPFPVSPAALDRLWTREAVFTWRDPSGRIGVGEAAGSEAIVRGALARLGYEGPGSLAELVARFQREHELLPDGVVGSRTLMALLGSGPEPRPRLKSNGRVS
ncbi:MAG TPA: peptidoglycan-binding domain-containing protein, partial [Vicinamibacteria bacterium]|nr:peptidoglycan-binding domain-containing protein [Vicinamibacteria bacterium]